jgi:hypothetical protein
MIIPFSQCGHFNKVGPSEKSTFLVVIIKILTSLAKGMAKPSTLL